MEGNALGILVVVEEIYGHSIGTQSHTDLVLHRFRKPKKSFVKADRLVIPSILFVGHPQVESDVGLLLDVLSAHPCLGSHQQLSERSFLAGQ